VCAQARSTWFWHSTGQPEYSSGKLPSITGADALFGRVPSTDGLLGRLYNGIHPFPWLAGLPPSIVNSMWSAALVPASRWGSGTRDQDFLNASLPLSQPVTVVDFTDVSEVMLASPSIIKLDNGLLLVVLERVPKLHSNEVTKQKRVRLLQFTSWPCYTAGPTSLILQTWHLSTFSFVNLQPNTACW
jgi:hypothetical protein